MATKAARRAVWPLSGGHFSKRYFGFWPGGARRARVAGELALSTLNRLWRTSANGNLRKQRHHPKVWAPYVLAFPHLSMLVPQSGQVQPPRRNSVRLTGFLRRSCSRPHFGQVTFRSNPLPPAMSQTEFRLRPHFPDLPAVSVAIISKTPPSTTVIITMKRNTMLSILETLRYVHVTFPVFACVVKSARQTKRTVSRKRPLRGSHFGTVDDGFWPVSNPGPSAKDAS